MTADNEVLVGGEPLMSNSQLFDTPATAPVSLADKFVVPPFSVLDRRSGPWQDRKRRWLSIGMNPELGRDDGLTFSGDNDDFVSGMIRDTGAATTSVFDPVLCELAYRWFSKEGASIIDPFAGGSVRGIVASHLGRRYYGVDIRQEQVTANQEQAGIANQDCLPRWIEDDSVTHEYPSWETFDFIFTCPPYADLEVYSDDPCDLSNMDYPEFLSGFKDAMGNACSHLVSDSFVVIVIGDARSKKGDGSYYGLTADTVNVMRELGLRLYNELVIIDPVGTLAVRSERQMRASCKVGRGHQTMLVFVKGNAAKAAKKIAPVADKEA